MVIHAQSLIGLFFIYNVSIKYRKVVIHFENEVIVYFGSWSAHVRW